MDWWRSWHGAPTDPKWLAIARDAQISPAFVISLAWMLFDHASQQSDRGDICGFDVAGAAAFMGCQEQEANVIMEEFQRRKIIGKGRILNWEKRQPKREDCSTERVRSHRKRIETHGNAPDTDTDTELDKKEKKKGARAPLAFDGSVIKLNEKDHTLWQKTFVHVELNAYLVSRDQFLASLPEDDNRRKNWMVSTSTDLRNQNHKSKSSIKRTQCSGKLSFPPDPQKISNEEWRKRREERKRLRDEHQII